MSFTVKEVEDAINKWEEKDQEENPNSYYDGVYDRLKWGEELEEIEGLGKLEYVDDYGGEGQGDDYWVVFKVGDQFFRKNGWYASYDGGELDGELYEVFPKEVTRTEYTTK